MSCLCQAKHIFLESISVLLRIESSCIFFCSVRFPLLLPPWILSLSFPFSTRFRYLESVVFREYPTQVGEESGEDQASIHGAFTELKPPNLGPVRAESANTASLHQSSAIEPSYGGRGGTGSENVQLEGQIAGDGAEFDGSSGVPIVSC